MELYPSLLTGLGMFKCSYEIKLKPDAQPHAVFTARTVSLPQRRVKTYGEFMGDITSRRAHRIVCRYGGCPEKGRGSPNMCGLPSAE